MKILVLNAGSSSLKFGVFDTAIEDSRIFKGEFEGFKNGECRFHCRCGGEAGELKHRTEKLGTLEKAIHYVPQVLKEFGYESFEAVGHRVAHGGARFQEPTIITTEVIEAITECTPLAPLHNPANLEAIRISQQCWPKLPQVAVFDTAFHNTIPEQAYTYAVPESWRNLGLRRYGFHGTSHKYVALRVAKELKKPVTDLQIISCHLGNGASVCAINRGFSVDNSMGMTALEGLVMGSRSGDVDPGMFSFLQQKLNLNIEQIEATLYSESGLKALAGTSDMREVEQKAAEGDAAAQLAINVYAYRARKYIGAYAAVMGGVDVIAFTGGIGENSASMRHRICDKFEFIGLHLDDDKNRAVKLQGFEAPQVQSYDSRIKVIVTQTCEQYMIAQETLHTLTQQKPAPVPKDWRLPVAVSARHAHLAQPVVEALFGKGYKLKPAQKIGQPDGWAAAETVDVIGPKGTLKNVRVMGPCRDFTQVEVSRTDTFTLGLEAPLRPSGKIENTPAVRLRGAKGEIETNGLIIAARHIHMSPSDAKTLELEDGDYVNVRVGDGERSVLFSNTRVRVKEGYVTEMHIDTDEANAAGVKTHGEAELVKIPTESAADIVTRKNMKLRA
jgi:acetate kinase